MSCILGSWHRWSIAERRLQTSPFSSIITAWNYKIYFGMERNIVWVCHVCIINDLVFWKVLFLIAAADEYLLFFWKFWSTNWHHRRGKPCTMNTVYSGDGGCWPQFGTFSASGQNTWKTFSILPTLPPLRKLSLVILRSLGLKSPGGVKTLLGGPRVAKGSGCCGAFLGDMPL